MHDLVIRGGTIVDATGEVVIEGCESTDARPGSLLRGEQAAPLP